jgi:hypothetical protein
MSTLLTRPRAGGRYLSSPRDAQLLARGADQTVIVPKMPQGIPVTSLWLLKWRAAVCKAGMQAAAACPAWTSVLVARSMLLKEVRCVVTGDCRELAQHD